MGDGGRDVDDDVDVRVRVELLGRAVRGDAVELGLGASPADVDVGDPDDGQVAVPGKAPGVGVEDHAGADDADACTRGGLIHRVSQVSVERSGSAGG
jgi:hypothetical protein